MKKEPSHGMFTSLLAAEPPQPGQIIFAGLSPADLKSLSHGFRNETAAQARFPKTEYRELPNPGNCSTLKQSDQTETKTESAFTIFSIRQERHRRNMKSIHYIRLFTGLLCLLTTTSLTATDIRVVAWNIEWFPGKQFHQATPEAAEAQMAAARKELERMRPDVLLSSEIRDWRSFADLVSVVPDMQVANVSPFVDRDEGVLWRQQLAIGSRLPILAAYAEPFQQTIGSMVRGFSFAALALPESDDVLLVYAVHLKSNRAYNEAQTQVNFRVRDESVVQILEHLDQMERLQWKGRIAGVVIGGDINTDHDGKFGDKVVQKLVDAGFRNTWAQTPREQRLTWRGNDGFEATTFDYIFTKGDRIRHGEAFLIEVPAEASDHHAVGLRVTVDPAK